jgi:protein-disulfide isomerase
MAEVMVKAGRWFAVALAAASVAATAQTPAKPASQAPTTQAPATQTPAESAGQPGGASAAPAAKPQPLQLQSLNPTTRADPFPAVQQSNFTAASPSVATVDSYLHAVMGFDVNRIWRVLAIQKTTAPGVSRVMVAVSDRNAGAKVLSAIFYVLPDGKHLIASGVQGGGVSPFGANPYADNRAVLEARADGPSRGAQSKDLMLVEFSDLQCPHCKEAQPTIDRLVADFPKARIVYENFPLVEVHPYAFEAAAYGVCIANKDINAFFKYEKAVFDTQAALVPATAEATLKTAAAKAGADPAATATCAATAATKAAVDAQVKLGAEIGVDQTPMLAVNGRLVPLAIPYETLRNLVVFQASLDGVSAAAVSPNGTGIPEAVK